LADRVAAARIAGRVQTTPAKAALVDTVTLSRSSCDVVLDVTPFPLLRWPNVRLSAHLTVTTVQFHQCRPLDVLPVLEIDEVSLSRLRTPLLGAFLSVSVIFDLFNSPPFLSP